VPHGWNYHWRSVELPKLTGDLIEALVELTWQLPSPHSYQLLFHIGGEVGRIDPQATAFAHRDATHVLNINGV